MRNIPSRFIQPDKKLIERCKAGDADAIAELVNGQNGYAYALAFRILLNEEEAKDAVQETFIKVWKSIGNYNDKYLFTTWLYRIVVNTCIDRLKQNKHTINIGLEDEFSDDFEEAIEQREVIRHIRQLSRGLSEKQRLVFTLVDLQGLSLSDTAEVLRMGAGQVKSNLYYARKNIREQMITSKAEK